MTKDDDAAAAAEIQRLRKIVDERQALIEEIDGKTAEIDAILAERDAKIAKYEAEIEKHKKACIAIIKAIDELEAMRGPRDTGVWVPIRKRK